MLNMKKVTAVCSGAFELNSCKKYSGLGNSTILVSRFDNNLFELSLQANVDICTVHSYFVVSYT